jgi:hypothetical protein
MVLEMAKLTAIDLNKQPKSTPQPVTVQFNPQTLSVSYHSSGSTGKQTGDSRSDTQGASVNITGFSSSLSMELLFDTSQKGDDVRNKTIPVAKMVQLTAKDKAPTVQFSWGTFIFNGVIQSMDETLDLFSERGVPLRATVRISMAGLQLEQQKPDTADGGAGIGFSASASFSAGASAGFSAQASINAGIGVGTTPLTLSQAGDTLQSLTGRAGISGSWKAVASANNIDNPRQMDPGTVLNLNASANVS